jgi:putative ATP-grasp target RiPP
MISTTIWRPRDMFPLAPSSRRPASGELTGNGRPFGLRYLVDPHPSATSDLDFAAVRFDETTQIAVMSAELGGIPLFKHTSGETSTTTNVNDRNSSDSDSDTEQDK